ncbi:SusC/RagA family TonB-linked outer membrane protein [Nostoc ellipsosporum NOK]|nr:SusC/RagA family TonB-linked outer membrane protein [Nostoc ellipsosporum NOK]
MLLGCSLLAFAQDKSVTGRVTDLKTGNPMGNVSVRVKNGTQTTRTDSSGLFTIQVPSTESILSFSHVGYSIYETKAGSGSLTIAMNSTESQMDDVIVVGYGTKKRANVLGSVGSMNPKEIEDIPFTNLSTGLVNKVPGVSVNQTSGKPGATTNLRIRNPTTFGNTGSVEPLYVIDGIAYNNPEGKEFFDNLDATMVDNISFLKDAAASVYGARGANGVILVTTKKGKPGRPRVSYSGSYGISDAVNVPQTLSAYEHVTLLNNKYRANPNWNTFVYDQSELDYAKGLKNSWFDETWEASSVQRHTVNISGGSDKITFFGGANYLKETGNLQDLYANKYGFRIGATAKITNDLTADISFSNDNSIMDRPTPKGITSFAGQSSDQADQMNATMAALLLIPKWVPMYVDGKPVYTTAPQWHPKELQKTNSYARTNSRGNNITASMNYKVPFIEGLSLRVSYGQNSRTSLGKEYYVSYSLYDFERTGTSVYPSSPGKQRIIYTNTPTASNSVRSIKNGNSLRISNDNSKSYQFNQAINYQRTFGKHDIDVLLLAEQSESSSEGFFSSVEGQVIPGVDELWGFTQDRAFYDHASSRSEIGRASYLGRINYAFMDRYLLEASYRADASPNFPPGSRWGYFPSVAVGWKISQENFFRGINFVDDLKLRVQVGLTGSDAVRNYQYLERYTQTTGMLFGNTMTNGLNPNAIPNPDITWEKALYTNFGLDGSFLKGKFNASIDVYRRYNTDMLETPTSTVPSTFGATIADRNYSRMKSWGVEGALGYNGKISKDFGFNVQVNLGWTDNKVLRRYYNVNADTGYKNPIGQRTDRGIEGYIATGILRTQADVDALLAKYPNWKIDGQAPQVGFMNYADLNGDGVITDADRTRIANRGGNIFGIGFNLGFSWKGLRLSVNSSLGIGGQRSYDNSARRAPTESQNGLSIWKDSWSPENPNAKYPVINSPLIGDVSTFWLTNATTWRINNAQLSYTLPAELKTRYKIPEMRLFVVATNLGAIINPQPYKDVNANIAIDYPTLRTVTFGANISL